VGCHAAWPLLSYWPSLVPHILRSPRALLLSNRHPAAPVKQVRQASLTPKKEKEKEKKNKKKRRNEKKKKKNIKKEKK